MHAPGAFHGHPERCAGRDCRQVHDCNDQVLGHFAFIPFFQARNKRVRAPSTSRSCRISRKLITGESAAVTVVPALRLTASYHITQYTVASGAYAALGVHVNTYRTVLPSQVFTT